MNSFVDIENGPKNSSFCLVSYLVLTGDLVSFCWVVYQVRADGGLTHDVCEGELVLYVVGVPLITCHLKGK